jgi:hypothetical protein
MEQSLNTEHTHSRQPKKPTHLLVALLSTAVLCESV